MSTEEMIKNSKLYFIEKLFSFFKNESAVITKRGESFRYLIKETINTSNEIKTVNSQIEVSRLSKALEYQITELEHVFTNNPIFENYLNIDIQQLKKLMKSYKPSGKKDKDIEQEKNKSTNSNYIYSLEFNKLINSLISFEKKLSQESLIKEHFIKVQSITDRLLYDQVDIIIDSLISELLYVCSTKYLIEKFEKAEKTLNLQNIDNDLQILCDNLALNTAALKNHEFIFKLELLDKTQKLKEQLLAINPEFIFDIKTFKTLENTIENFVKAEEHFTSSRKHILYLYKQVNSTDIYKASKIANEEVKDFLHTYILLDKTFKVEINVKGLYREDSNQNWKMRDIIFRENNYTKVMSLRERNDIQLLLI